jgi:hypothetical protein
MDELYRIKMITYDNSRIPILMQNRNGPCPLLAISNVLLLRKKIYIHADLAFIDFSQLVQLVGSYLVEFNPPHPNHDMRVFRMFEILCFVSSRRIDQSLYTLLSRQISSNKLQTLCLYFQNSGG